MLIQLVVSAVLNSTLAGMSPPEDGMLRLAESAGNGNQATISAEQQCADRDMKVGRYYLDKQDRTAAVSRFKLVVTQCSTSSEAEEALAHITEIFLALGIPSEAQTAAAVLERKFANGKWSIEARNTLRSAGLEPIENRRSWIALPFK